MFSSFKKKHGESKKCHNDDVDISFDLFFEWIYFIYDQDEFKPIAIVNDNIYNVLFYDVLSVRRVVFSNRKKYFLFNEKSTKTIIKDDFTFEIRIVYDNMSDIILDNVIFMKGYDNRPSEPFIMEDFQKVQSKFEKMIKHRNAFGL